MLLLRLLSQVWLLFRRRPRLGSVPERANQPTAPVVPISDEELLARLWQIVRREQIPVLPRNWIMWSRQTPTWGQACLGKYDLNRRVIWLRPDYFRNPWVLAHELGHDVLRAQPSHSEEEADAAGRALVLSLLTELEAKALMWRIDAFLPALGATQKESA